MSRINTGDSSSERGRERYHPQLNVSIDMHSCVCKLLRVKCQKLDKNLCQEYTLLTQAMREGEGRERSLGNWTPAFGAEHEAAG